MIYRHNDREYAVTLKPQPDGTIHANVGDRAYVLTAEAIAGGWRLTLDGESVRIYTAARGSERYVSLNGESLVLTAAEGRQRRAAAGGGDLTAPMPGQVREVLAQSGEAVTRGQTLLLLEAMKMEIRVSAPADGRIRRVLVKAGDLVDRGQRLVEME